MNKKTKEMQGITLILLVITIVVLIILATVSLNSLLSSNKLLVKSQEVKEATTEALKKERKQLDFLEDMINNQGNNRQYSMYMWEIDPVLTPDYIDETIAELKK